MPLIKLRAGRYMLPVYVEAVKGRLYLQFPYNKILLEEIKSMKDRRWHGYDKPNPRKLWSIKDCARNRFQLSFLAGKDPYAKYDKELIKAKPNREILRGHQVSMFRHAITRMQSLISGEMGVGKTLSAIEAMEYTGYNDFIWVGTGSAIAAVKLEFRKWKCKIKPLFLTYTGFTIAVQKGSLYIPKGIIFDEAQKLKSHNSQRSVAACTFTEEMVVRHNDPFILAMSGAPAPNKPTDWWNLCEVVCPGYLKEGDKWKFERRLAVMTEGMSASNQAFPKLVTWRDDTAKCNICGDIKEMHDALMDHTFIESKNEVEFLYERMNGLNIVFFKRDCLDLPELQYRVIKLEPTEIMKRAEKLIIKTTPRTITALMKIRELSDGFQYTETKTGENETCPLCNGNKKTTEFYDPELPEEYPSPEAIESGRCKERQVSCTNCSGVGEIEKIKRTAVRIANEKVTLLKQLLEEHEDIGRFVVYAGFQASVDICVETAVAKGWDVIRADGRGWVYLNGGVIGPTTKEDMLEVFQDPRGEKIIFIGQAGAAGTGLTLTASPSIFFYSNSFNGDDRIQAIARIHRMGMGDSATIIDCVCLDTDQYVLDNLNKKEELLNMSMGRFRKAMKEFRAKDDEYVLMEV